MDINEMFTYIQDYILPIGAAGLILALAALVYVIVLNRKINKLKQRYIRLTCGMDGRSMEDIIAALHEKLGQLQQHSTRLSDQVTKLNQKSVQAYRGLGLVRFNAFLETGGEISFAVALINDEFDGILITGIYGREDSCTYAKGITGGKCDYRLMKEEQQAIEVAIKNMKSSDGN